jgi:hypothetical protein
MTFSSGSNVSVWKDKSGNGKNATTSTNNPTYQPSSLNSLGTVRFAGASGTPNFLDVPAFDFGTGNRTLFMVIQNTGPTSGVASYPVLFWPNAGNGTNSFSIQGWISAAVQGSGIGPSYTAPINTYTLLGYRLGVSAGFEELLQNGITQATGTKTSGGSAYANATSGYRIGWLNNGDTVNTYYFDGNIAEVILYNTTLTNSQRQQIEGYLAHKWGLNTALTGGLAKPTQIPGCALWLDGADPSSLTFSSGSNVSQWRDKSGNDRNANVSSNAFATWSNTTSGLQFNNSFYTTPYTADPPSETAFLVFRYTGTNNLDMIMVGAYTSGREIAVYNGDYVTAGLIKASIAWLPRASFTPQVIQLITTQSSSSATSVSVNGGTATTGGGVTFTSGNVTTLGRENGTGGGYVGSIYELILFSNVLTPVQRQSVEGYLATKWGLRASLPSTHPSFTGIAAQPFALMRPFARRFQPVDIPGCALWLDAADQSSMTFSSGSNVSSWKDKSPNAFPFTVVSGQSAPVLQQSFNGNYPAVTALNTTSVMYYQTQIPATTLISSTGITYFMVGKCSSGALLAKFFDAGSGVRIISFETGSSFRSDFNTTIVSPGNNTLIPFLICSRYDGASTAFTLFYNGISVASSNVTAPSYSFTSWIALFGQYTGQGDFYGAAGSICEFLSYSSSLSTSQRQQVEGYLAWKWGLNAQLPGVPLNPKWQSGLALWLDAADPAGTGSQPAINSSVATWVDKSGNGRNASAVSAASFTTGGISFTSGNYYNMSVPYSSNYSIFLVATNTSAAQTYFFSRTSVSTGNWPTFIQGFIGSGIGLEWYESTDRATIATTPTSTFMASVDHRQGTNITGYYNGTQSFSITQTEPYVASPWDRLGGAVNSGGVSTNFYAGVMKELIFFGSNLSTSQRQGVETYLARKWGLTVPTSTPHPFFRLPSSSVAVFSPTMISGCALWLDAADQSSMTFSSGSNIATWNDKSGNARNATNAGTGNPLWATSIINGVPAIQFNDGNFLTTPSFTMDTITRTAFVVYRHTANTFPADGVYYNFYPLLGSNTNGFQLYTFRMNTSPYNWGAGLGITSVGGFPDGPAYFSGNTQPANPNFLICGQRSSSNTGVITYNGTSQSTNFANTTSLFPATDILRVGRTTTNTGSGNIAGHYIGEILLYNTALTAAQRQSVEGYLSQKWGISVPTTHPFSKFSPPAIP